MNPNKINNNFSAEYGKDSRESLEYFINPENYIDYFDNKMPLTLDAEYNDENSYDEVDKLVNVFNRLESESICNKDTFNNLLNLSYCRAAQFSTFTYADINPFSVLILDTVSDIKSDSKFVNRLIEEIEFNEYENTPKYYQSISIDNPRLKFIKNYINFGPDYRGLYKSTIEHDINEDYDSLLGDDAYKRIGLSGNETLNSHYVELEVLGLFGVTMADIKEEARDLLFDWGVNLTSEDYDKLKDISKSKSLDHRIKMANAFLSIEFGDEFGHRLVKIADRYDDEISKRIYLNINQIRQDSIGIAKHFDFYINQHENNPDKNIRRSIEKAWIKRTTEVLALLADDYVDSEDIDCALVSLDVLRYLTANINIGLDQELHPNKNSSNKEADHITLNTENGVTVTLRANFDPEKWNQRIGVSLKIPENLIPDNIKLVKGKNKKVSIRLDFDEFGLSLDIGSMNIPGLNVSPVGVLIGETLIKGESLMDGDVKHGNHVREVFEEYDMDSNIFAEIVGKFIQTLNIAS